MPLLKNPKHERFAQELAKGKTADEAYQLAGYSGHRSNAARLSANDSVRSRVEELQGKTAEKTAVTAAMITERLLKIAEASEGYDSPNGQNVARNALMDVAKLNGLIVDRSESRVVLKDITDKPLSDDEWTDRHADSD